MKNLALLALVFFIGYAAAEIEDDSSITPPNIDERTHQLNIYMLQHRHIPRWVHYDDLYNDLKFNNGKYFFASTAAYVNEEYAKNINLEFVEIKNAILIEFPKPKHNLNCYFALIVPTNDGNYHYITYENPYKLAPIEARDSEYNAYLESQNIYGVIGAWDLDGHHNHGERKYRTSEEFVFDVLNNIVN